MSVIHIKGDLLAKQHELKIDVICHQVNCQGRMGSGIAKGIREKYPAVYDNYMEKCTSIKNPVWNLGTIQYVPIYEEYTENGFNPQVCNFFSQLNYGYDGARYTSYDAFWDCLNWLKKTTPEGKSIGFPARIGCGLGGANWDLISQMICVALGNDYTVYIVDYEGDK